MSQSRKKLFIENFIAYGAINALDKIVPLVMLPIITRYITDPADYGRFEMFNTIVGFGSSFAILGMYDAMFREYFERDNIEYRNLVTSTAVKVVLFSSIFVSLVLVSLCNPLSNIFFGSENYRLIVIFSSIGVFLTANKAIISAPTRMKNQRKIFIISGLSYSLLYYVLSYALILFGLSYYGLIFGYLTANLYIVLFFFALNKNNFNFSLFDKKVASELLKIGVPLVPIFIIYWAFQSMDRIMITNMLGLKEVGIYSIGAKVASVSMFIYMAFSGGWQYFAFSTMKDNDQVDLTSKIFEYLGILSFLVFAVAILFNNFIFNLFFTGDYIKGSLVFPYLFLSPLVLMLFQTAGNQLLIIKKSYISTVCLTIGLIFCLCFNYLLIPVYGIKGAAMANLSGYVSSVLAMAIVTIKLKLLHIKPRFVMASIITTAIITNIFFNYNNNLSYLLSILLFVIVIIKYYPDFRLLINKH